MKTNIDQLIIDAANPYKKDFNKVLKLINQYDKICIFRHVRPDFDAIGTQLGLATWIKDNFPNKDVKVVGENHVTLTPNCFPYMDNVNDEWFNDKFLAIAVDTASAERISDERFKFATRLVKIDHHPNIEPYGRLKIVNDQAIAAGEFVATMLLTYKGFNLTKEAARWLYIAIAGDSNRFMFSTTTPASYAIAKELLLKGFDVGEVHRTMYAKSIDSIEVTRYILNTFKVSEHGVAYYILTNDDLKRFNLKPEQGKDNINLFDHFDQIHIWVSITEDVNKNVWRVSIRSSKTPIDDVASKFLGGGHAQASGAKLKSLDELPKLIEALDTLLQK